MAAMEVDAEAGTLQLYQRDVNCLSDDDRTTRRRALTRLAASVSTLASDEAAGMQTLAALWEQSLRAPLLKLLADPVEKNRELALALTAAVLEALPQPVIRASLAHVAPAAAARLSSSAAAEPTEELRLELLRLLRALARRAGTPLSVYLPEIAAALRAGFADPFPDAKKAARLAEMRRWRPVEPREERQWPRLTSCRAAARFGASQLMERRRPIGPQSLKRGKAFAALAAACP